MTYSCDLGVYELMLKFDLLGLQANEKDRCLWLLGPIQRADEVGSISASLMECLLFFQGS